MRVRDRFFGSRDFLYLKLGIRDLKAESGPVSGLKVYFGGWDAKSNPRDSGIARNFASGFRG